MKAVATNAPTTKTTPAKKTPTWNNYDSINNTGTLLL